MKAAPTGSSAAIAAQAARGACVHAAQHGGIHHCQPVAGVYASVAWITVEAVPALFFVYHAKDPKECPVECRARAPQCDVPRTP